MCSGVLMAIQVRKVGSEGVKGGCGGGGSVAEGAGARGGQGAGQSVRSQMTM